MEGLFNFEQDGRYALRRIPMCVRYRLDECGLKISLAAWILLSRDEREKLLTISIDAALVRQTFRDTLLEMLKPHADNPDATIEEAAVNPKPACLQTVPTVMVAHLTELALPVPALNQWQNLSNLQRFTLIKLTRPSHRNSNLRLALQEFGLM